MIRFANFFDSLVIENFYYLNRANLSRLFITGFTIYYQRMIVILKPKFLHYISHLLFLQKRGVKPVYCFKKFRIKFFRLIHLNPGFKVFWQAFSSKTAIIFM